MKIEDAIIFATQKHSDQTRKDGSPYIFHPIYVCNLLKDKGFPIEYQIAGLFHDLLENTDATEEEIVFGLYTYKLIPLSSSIYSL